MAEEIRFDIVADFNTESLDSLTNYVSKARDEIVSMKKDLRDSMDGMDAPARLLAEQLDRCVATADQLAQKTTETSKAVRQDVMSEDTKREEAARINNMLADFNAMKTALTGDGAYSVTLAKQMLSGLPGAVQQEFSAIAPQVVSAMRRGFNSLNRGNQKITGTTADAMVQDAMDLTEIQSLLRGTSATQAQKEGFVRSLLMNATQVQRTVEYQNARFGHTVKQASLPTRVEEILPELYKGAYANQGFVSGTSFAGKQNAAQGLSIAGTSKLLQLIQNNPVAARAAEASGLMHRNGAGALTLDQGVTRGRLLDFSSSLWDEFHTRTRGLTNRFDDYYATSASEKERDAIEKRIVQRAYSGTGGTTLAAMQVVSDLLAQEQFADKVGQVHRVIDPNTEAKRLKEQYTVEKLTPFSPVDPTGSKKVTLAESQMTRMLGMQGRNYQDLDAVKLISLAGYDASNPEHVQRLRELQEQGYTGSQGHYSVHAMHGTGENTVLRMIRDQERQAITARYTPFAQQLGLVGTDVFNAFVPTNMEFKDPAALGKHMEQLNKMWTDSYVLGSDISGKKFAFVDFSQDKDHQFSDGLGFMGKGILPGAIQARFGLSGKGSFYEMGTETVGEWAKNAGRLDDQGRYMVKGIDGTMFDASQYHGLIDISQMKNLAAYNGLNNAQANTALTAILREFPIAAVADYNYDGDAAGLGPQMMTFLAMSPAMQQHQATNVAQRLRDLQTLEGQRRYVFNNPESDIVSRMANDPVHGDEFMLSDPRVKDRVDTYVDSLMRRSASGEFINFNDIANIQNERLLRSPIVADFMTRGGMTDAEVAHHQDIFQKVHGREFTPEEVRKYMMLEGGVADFGHEDASQVAALRSPTGFGQLLVRENYASMLRPVLEYLGETPTGFHANNEDYKTLAGADMDADEVKAIADKANKLGPNKSQLSLVSELAKVKEIADSYGISAKEAEVLTHALPALAGGNNIGNTENWLRMAALSIKAPMEMGVYSDVGSRLAGNLDLFDQTMRSAAVIATKANNGYDPATTLNKKPAEIEHDKQVYAALRLGQEYQKIPAHIKDVYNVDSHYDEKSDSTYYTTKDGETLIDPKDVFKTSNGRLMNLSYFRGMDGTRLDKTNLPSVLSTPMLGAMLGAKINSELGLADSTLTTDLLEAFGVKEVEGPKVGEGVSFNGAGEATKALMANKRTMLAQFIGQQRFSISNQERDVLASQYAASMEEIEKEAASKLEQGGVIKDENGKYVGRQQYVSTQARKFGLDQVALMLGMYKGPDGQLLNTGLTQSNIEAKYGANFAQALQNGAGVTLPYMTPAVFSPEYQRYATYYNRGQVGAQHVASAQAPVIQQPEQQQRQQAAQNSPTLPTTPPSGNNPPNNNPAYDPAVLEAKFESMRAGSREDMQELLRGESAIEAAQNIIEDARKFKSSMSKERYSDRELTAAQKWYGSNKGYLQYLQNAYDEFDQKGHSAIAGNSAIAVQAKNAIADAQYEFVEARDTHARKAITDSTERLDRLINGRGTEADAQLEKVAKWDEVIDGVISERSEYLKSLGDIEDKMSGKNGQSRSDNRLQEFDQQIDMLQERRDQGFENLIKENAQMFEDVTASFDKMIEGKDRSPQAKIQRTLEKARTDLTQKDQTLDDFYNKGLLKKEDYDRIKADYAVRFGKLDDGTYQAQLESYLNVNQELSQLQHDMQLNQFMRQGGAMSRNMYGQNRGIIGRALAHREQALTSWQNRKVAAEKQLAAETKARDKIDKDKDPEAYAKATDNINALQQASDQASSAIEKLSDPMATAASVAAQFGDVVGRLATRLGRQLFRKALNEAKKFVQEFDKSMTTIQMITLKSDSQMSTLGDGLIAKAKELKISISEITQSAETLYRQGLSDEEVNERLDIISKFSKVSGTKVDAATKLITVAMNTGLVSDPQVAADIVTALGDNAATNASEIEKGIEKAGAAAAADGTTFAQLASMLTAITSTTQIGGNVAGRTLNTIFGRMNKIGTNELIYDENGHAISGSAVAKLLTAQGISQYDTNGNKRSFYDVLYDLSQKWDRMSDAEQQQMANAIAGTRQYSNFAAIMQGMSEGKVSEYMNLTGSAEGIVDEKYEIYVKSLQASLTDLKNTFDELVHDLTSSGTLTGFLDTVTGMIKGVDNLTNSVGGLGAALSTVVPMLIGLTLLKTGMSSGSFGMVAAGLGVAAVGGLIASSAGNQTTNEERYQNSVKLATERYDTANTQIERAKALQEKGSNRTAEETQEYTKLISNLANMFNLDDPTKSVDAFTSSLDSVSAAAANAAQHSKEYANVIKQADEENETERIRNLASTSSGWASTAAGNLATYRDAQNKSSVMDSKYLADFFVTDEAGNQTIDVQKFFNVSALGFSNTANDSGIQQALGGALNNWESVPGLGAFIDWAAPGARKLVGKNADQMEYSWNKNAPRLAQLLSDAMSSTAIMDKDMFAQLQAAGYTGYTTDDWLKYLNDIHSGKTMSTLPIQMLQKAVQTWAGSNTIEQGSKEQIKSDFKSQIKSFAPWLEDAQIDAMAGKAAEDVVMLESNGYGTSLAYSTVLSDIFNLSSQDYSQEAIKTASNAYLARTGYEGQEPTEQKRTYHGKVYDTQKDALAAQAADYETYKKEHGINESSFVDYGGRGWLVGADEAALEAQREEDRQKAVNEQIDSLLEQSYQKGYYWNNKLQSPEEVSSLFETFKLAEQHEITHPEVFSYTDSTGKTTASTKIEDVDKERYKDYQRMAIEAAVTQGKVTDFLKEEGGVDVDALMEWYESQRGNKTYDDFAMEHQIGRSTGIMYNGKLYNSPQEAEQDQMDDFWAMVGEEQGFYEIGGERYTTKAEAIKGGREYLQKQWDETHKIGEAEGVITYNGKEYDSVEAAEEQRRKDFYEAEENAIAAATEEELDNIDVLHAGTATGLNAWTTDNKNAYALRADTMRRNMEAAGVTDMASMIAFLQGEGAVDWKYLTENNGEFARLVDSIQYDAEGNVINPEVYNQVMDFLRTNGRDLGAPVHTATQKAQTAQSMFEHLVGEEQGYLSIEEARAAAQRQYETEQAAYEDEIQRLTDERVSQLTGYVSEETRAKYEAEIRAQNPYTGKTANQIAAGYRVYTDEEKTYLKEAVGEQMYDRLIKGNASAEEITYARQMLGNRAVGLTSLTTSQQLSGLKDLRKQIAQGRKIGEGEGDYQTTIASQYLSGWSGAGEYLALLAAKGTDKFAELGGQERLDELSQSLDNFQQQTQIKFDIEGVQALEEAGKVADGTAAKLEKLQKGGDIAIKVSYEIQSEARSTAQLGARLNNGTRAERLEAIKSLTGYSDAQIQSMGYDQALSDAQQLYNIQNGLQVASLEEYYARATTDEERALIDRIAYGAGYTNAYDDRGFMLNGKYKLGNNKVDREDAFFNAQQLYAASTLAAAQSDILEGRLTANTAGREEEYTAAAAKMGEQATEYLRMLGENATAPGTYDEAVLTEQLIKARAEIANQVIQAAQEDLQKELGLSSDKYTRDHAQEIAQNRTTLAYGTQAEQLAAYSSLAGSRRSLVGAQYALTNYTGLESASVLASFLKMDERDVREALATNSGRSALQSAINDETKNMYSLIAQSVTDSFDFNPETGDLSDLRDALLEAANNTTGEARNLLLNLANSISEAGELIGQSDASFADEYNKIMSQFADAAQKRSGFDWLRDNFEQVAGQNRTYREYVDKNGNYIPGGTYEKQHTLPEMIQANTDNPQIAKLLSEHPEIVAAMNMYDSGKIDAAGFNNVIDYAQYGQSRPGLTGTLVKGLFDQSMFDESGMFKIPETSADSQKFLSTLEDIRRAGDGTSEMLDILFEKYPDLKEFFELGDRNKAAEALKEINAQMTNDKVSQAAKFTKSSKNVAEAMALIRKGGKEAAEGYAMLRKNSRDRVDQMTAFMVGAKDKKGNYKAGDKLSAETRNVIASAFDGIDADDLKDYTAQQIEELLADFPEYLNQQLVDDLNAGLAGMGPITIDTNAVTVDASGNVDLSSLDAWLSATDAEIYSRLKAMIEAQGGEWGSVQFKVDDQGNLVVVSANTKFNKGGGYSKGGSGKKSGGGGGKSAAQAAIDAAKHYVSQAQHMANMAEADLYHPDKINDYGGYVGAIQTNIYTQEQLAQVTKDQIQYLKEQRAKVKEGTDDWWALTEAINGYEESLAKLEQTIDELNKKMFEEAKEQFTYKITSTQHKMTMSDIDRTYYGRINNYDKEREEIDNKITQQQEQARNYQDAIATYMGLQSEEFKKHGKSDYWWELQQEIDSLTESLASLKNEMAELNAEKLNVNIEVRTHNLAMPQQEASIMSYDEQILSRQNSYGSLMALYDAQLANNEKQRKVYQDSIKANEELLATQEAESDEWYATLAEIYKDQNALLELAVSDRDILAKRIDAIKEAYQSVFDELTHRENMLTTQQETYGFTNDYDQYFENLNSYVMNKRQTQQVLRDYITRLKSEQSNWEAGSDEWNTLQQEINSAEESEAKIQNDINNIWAQRLEAMKEKQEHELSPLTHENTMLGYEEQKYDRLNNYDAYIETLDKENEVRRNMMATQVDQIEELKAEQALVDEGSDAWWNLQTQIDSVTQAYNENSKAIDENNKKRINALKQQQQAADKPMTHAFEVLNLALERSQLLDDQGMYEGVINDRVDNIRASIEQNDRQVSEWEELLKSYVEGSDEWLQVRDEVWAVKLDTAKIENEALKLENDLAAKRLANIQKQNKRSNAEFVHESSMLDTEAKIYQSYSNYDQYRQALEEQIQTQQQVQANAVAARDAILEQMATLEKGSSAWYDARDAAYAYDEQIASTSATMLEKQQAIEASRIQEFTENFNTSQIESNLNLTAVRAQRAILERSGDWEGYRAAGAKEKEILEQQLADKRAYVNGLKDLLAETTKGTSQWKSLRDTIAQELANIANMEATLDQVSYEQTQTEIEHMLERMSWDDSNRQHNLTLIRYEQTKYENAGELSNYGIMLEKEREVLEECIEAETQNIKRLKEKLDTLAEGTKEYKQIVEEIKKHEEALASDTTELKKNEQAQKENLNAIRKAQKDLEDAVDKELRTREEERKKRLKAEVSLQNTLLDTLKDAYKKQWELEKKDLDKKKDALEKEKSMINERLNARKSAMETEDKYRELEELKRQLSLISNDPTRTRDAKELRERINQIEKDISWDKAFEEAETATKQIDDEIQAINDYVTVHDDNLEEMLSNANNFAGQIALIMEGGWNSIDAFLTQNNQSFLDSTEAMQQEMEEGWKETWETMTGFAKTYWDQIAEILSSYETFVSFMKDSTEYLTSSDVGKQILEYGWEVLYENWKNSGFISDEATNYETDEHPWTEGESSTTIADILGDAASDWMNLGLDSPNVDMTINNYNDIGEDLKPHAVELTDLETNDTYTGIGITAAQEDAAKEGGESSNTPINASEPSLTGDVPIIVTPDLSTGEYKTGFDYDYSGVGTHYEEEAPSAYAQVYEKPVERPAYKTPTSGSPTGGNKTTTTTTTDTDKYYDVYDEHGIKTNWQIKAGSAEEAKEKLKNDPTLKTYYSTGGTGSAKKDAKTTKVFATGGLVDYTGPAWVDGTKTHPEAFLSAYDTEQIGKLAEALRYVFVSPGITPSSECFNCENTNVGDINITINQAELKDDADFEDVARRVGKAFTKQLSKEGFNLTGYSL